MAPSESTRVTSTSQTTVGAARSKPQRCEQRPELLVGELLGAERRDPLAVLRRERGRVAQHNLERTPVRGERRLGQEQPLHLREHARDSLALVADGAQVDERANESRVAAPVDAPTGDELVERDLGDEAAGALDLHTVLEEPDLGAVALDRVVAVGDGVDERLLPREVGVLGHLAKAVPDEPRRTTQERPDRAHRLVDNRGQRALDARALLDVVLGTEAALGADDAEDADAGIRVVGAKAREQRLCRAPEHEARSTAIRELPREQVVDVAPRLTARAAARAEEERVIEVGEGQRRRSALPALGEPVELEGLDLRLGRLHRAVADAEGKPLPST